MTTPINSDKHPSPNTTHASTGRHEKTSAHHGLGGETAKNSNQSTAVTEDAGGNVDISRANQMLDLAKASQTQDASGNIQNDVQAKAALDRFEALLAEDPVLALQAQASNLNEMHGALLEVQPT